MHDIPDYMMEIFRQRLDLEKDDTSEDENILKYSPEEKFREMCQWNGFLGGWDETIKSWIEDAYGVKLEEMA